MKEPVLREGETKRGRRKEKRKGQAGGREGNGGPHERDSKRHRCLSKNLLKKKSAVTVGGNREDGEMKR